MGDIFGLLIGIAICVLIFLALRQIMLWYWKVDTIIENQEKLIKLLEEQAVNQIKHNQYIEKNVYAIKHHLTEPK